MVLEKDSWKSLGLQRDWKVVAELQKTPEFLAFVGEELNPEPVTRLDHSELLCNKVLLKYKRDRENFWHIHQKWAERVPWCTYKLLELVSEFGNVARFKVNAHKNPNSYIYAFLLFSR